jgi:hypothetical protein
MGKTLDLEDIGAAETYSFQYSDKPVAILSAFSENNGYAKFVGSEYFEHITKQGDKKQKYNVVVNSVCVTETGDVYVTGRENKAVVRLSPSGSVSTVVSTRPFIPGGICQSPDGGLLVTMEKMKPNTSLLRHMTLIPVTSSVTTSTMRTVRPDCLLILSESNRTGTPTSVL